MSRESWHKAQETRHLFHKCSHNLQVSRLLQPMIAQPNRVQFMIVQLTRVQLYVVLQTYNKSVALMQPTNSI